MKKILAVVLALSLVLLLAACNKADVNSSLPESDAMISEIESSETPDFNDSSVVESADAGLQIPESDDDSSVDGDGQTTTTTTTVRVADTTTSAVKTTETTRKETTAKASATTTTTTTTKATTTTTTTTKPTTTTTTKATVSTVDPAGIVNGVDYKTEPIAVAGGLETPMIMIDQEYCVLATYYHTETPNEDNKDRPYVYQGKTYYPEGAGQSPYEYAVVDKEVHVKEMGSGRIVVKFVLLSDGDLRITYSEVANYVVGALFRANSN